MSALFASEGLKGFANWFKVQFQEGQGHAPKSKSMCRLIAFEDTLAHGKVVTG